jgi:DNA repair exonuclease SbcCD ATPase subunit
MKFVKLILKNFMSFESLEYDFEDRPLLVQGRNLTDDGQESNGSGKSGFQSGLEYAIKSSLNSGVKDAGILTFGKKEGLVSLTSYCGVRNEFFKIERTIKRKGSNKLSLTTSKDGEVWTDVSFSNINDGNNFILKWFDISKDDFFNYFIINKNKFKSFYQSSNREKVELINRFHDASIIDGVDDFKIDSSNKDYLLSEINKNEGKIEMLEESLEIEYSKDFSKDAELKKDKINFGIDDLKKDIEKTNIEISNVEKKIIKLKGSKKNISNSDSVDLKIKNIELKESELNDKRNLLVKELDTFKASVDKNRDELNKEYNKLREEGKKVLLESNNFKSERKNKNLEHDKISKRISKIDSILSGQISCPSCSHEFLLKGDLKELAKEKSDLEFKYKDILLFINDLSSKILEKGDLLEQMSERASQIKKSFEVLDSKVFNKSKEINSKISKIDKSLIEISKSKNSILNEEVEINKHNSYIDSEIHSLENKINKVLKFSIKISNDKINILEKSLKDVKVEDNKDVILEIESKIKSLSDKREVLNKDYLEEVDRIEDLKKWSNRLKEFKMFLANKSLEVLEYHNNRYLKDMKTDLTVRISGFKKRADGSIKDEINVSIFREEERLFNSFSGGERGRLLFASILANRYMINLNNKYGGLDFLSIDEVFEGIDGLGLKNLIKPAKELKIPVMIVTHVTTENTNGDILTIEKINGISKIVN